MCQSQIEVTSDFKEIKVLLTEYQANPSQQLSNRIAVKLLPFIRQTVRRALYERSDKAMLMGYDDAVNELYLVAVYAIQNSVNHPAPMGYVIVSIRGMFKHFLVNQLSKYRNYSYLADVSEFQKLRLATHYKMPEIEDISKVILSAIASLPNKQRQVAILSFVQGYGLKEVATKLRCHRMTVKYHQKQARKMLSLTLLKYAQEWEKLPTVKNRAIQLHRSGVERSAICDRLGLSSTALNNLLWRAKL